MKISAYVVIIAIVVLVRILKAAGGSKSSTAKRRQTSDVPMPLPAQTAPRMSSGETRQNAPIESVSAARRVQARNDAQWREAKRQQDDAEQLHSVHMDACESKLQSLRVLYDAGILDREEYAQRVARVQARHSGADR